MRRRFGGRRVPPEVLGRAGLQRREKVLAAAPTDDGRWLLGTRDAFVVVGAAGVESADGADGVGGPDAGRPEVLRLPWEQVETADWDRGLDRLRVGEVTDFGLPRRTHHFQVGSGNAAAQLLQLVRERVTASVLLRRRVAVNGRRGLTVVARRPPRGTGEVIWAFELDAGVDPEDPLVRAAADHALRLAQDEVGPGG